MSGHNNKEEYSNITEDILIYSIIKRWNEYTLKLNLNSTDATFKLIDQLELLNEENSFLKPITYYTLLKLNEIMGNNEMYKYLKGLLSSLPDDVVNKVDTNKIKKRISDSKELNNFSNLYNELENY